MPSCSAPVVFHPQAPELALPPCPTLCSSWHHFRTCGQEPGSRLLGMSTDDSDLSPSWLRVGVQAFSLRILKTFTLLTGLCGFLQLQSDKPHSLPWKGLGAYLHLFISLKDFSFYCAVGWLTAHIQVFSCCSSCRLRFVLYTFLDIFLFR